MIYEEGSIIQNYNDTKIILETLAEDKIRN